MRSQRFDVAVTMLFGSDVIGRLLARAAGVPRIISSIRARNVDYAGWQRWLVRRTMSWADAVVLNSAQVRDYAISEEGVPPDRLFVIPNGVRVEDYFRPMERAALCAEFDLPRDQCLVGSVGRLTHQKGFDLLLQALALNRLSKAGILLAAGVLLISLLIYPTWPWRWVSTLGQFESMIPLLALTGIGLLLLLALLKWRSPRARLLLFMSVLPFRGAYDLVPLFLVPNTAFGISLLVILSWIPAFIDPWGAMAVKPAWAIAFLFFPALVLTLAKK